LKQKLPSNLQQVFKITERSQERLAPLKDEDPEVGKYNESRGRNHRMTKSHNFEGGIQQRVR
jgi:hypothetical protein